MLCIKTGFYLVSSPGQMAMYIFFITWRPSYVGKFKSSPLISLNHIKPSYTAMILEWSHLKMCPVAQASTPDECRDYKNRNFFSCLLLLHYKSKLANILNEDTWQCVVWHIFRFLLLFYFSRFDIFWERNKIRVKSSIPKFEQ